MKSNSTNARSADYFPDALDENAIEALISGVDQEIADLPEATSALLDGSAAERRLRRMQRRTLADLLRTASAAGMPGQGKGAALTDLTELSGRDLFIFAVGDLRDLGEVA
ncbi:hypothetical protein [Pseudonocardia spinosispora]|uniref:hypothetical protein n=1 Tax=Pseudonocardia spinosispora TaxID=103441 RepID=UPI000416CEA9|nr:hypothetical protein [Pseudonocardia spinosispora]